MIPFPATQRSEEWAQKRAGIATGSQLRKLLTPARLELSASAQPFAQQVAAFRVFGVMPDEIITEAMDRGTMMEPEAIDAFTMDNGLVVTPVGLCLHDTLPFGASPDGFIGDDAIYEGKARKMAAHLDYLLQGTCTAADVLQMQGEMLATDRKRAYFYAYYPGLPSLTVIVERDEAVIQKIKNAIWGFEALVLEYVAKFEALK